VGNLRRGEGQEVKPKTGPLLARKPPRTVLTLVFGDQGLIFDLGGNQGSGGKWRAKKNILPVEKKLCGTYGTPQGGGCLTPILEAFLSGGKVREPDVDCSPGGRKSDRLYPVEGSQGKGGFPHQNGRGFHLLGEEKADYRGFPEGIIDRRVLD